MTSKFWLIVILAIWFGASGACAQGTAGLTQTKGCMNCHAIDQKRIGPAFKDIAAQYAGNASAEATLIAKLKNGSGHPKASATDPELKAMIDYVLGSK